MPLSRMLVASLLSLCGTALPAATCGEEPTRFSVMTWNIWHGGREDGDEAGPGKVIDIIRDSGADLVAMQETYGSGERISRALEFHFHPRGTNVSIHSRYPIVEDLSVGPEFRCVGALIEIPGGKHVAFYSVWLPYSGEIWEAGSRDGRTAAELQAACAASEEALRELLSEIQERLSASKYADVPVILAGDFNSMSHRDYIPAWHDDYPVNVDWPTSRLSADAGFRDAWRDTHPEVKRSADRTWTPRFSTQEQDRIDYIYYRSDRLRARGSRRIDQHPNGFPSDHAAVITDFTVTAEPAENECRVLSYNIKHGQGTDGQLNLNRTAAVIQNLRPDIIGLQEVDENCSRSGNTDQAKWIGRQLGMESAFGAFMNFQGGRYGLAVLSRYPIVQQRVIRLPDGNEPRVALACDVRFPDNRVITVVNVHFDWVSDDTFRWAQAQQLRTELDGLPHPWILLGDFNDQPASRTVQLLSTGCLEAEKRAGDSFSFSSVKPSIEIDFIFASPRAEWRCEDARLFEAPVTSDHRPLLAILRLKED